MIPSSFSDLGISEPILQAVSAMGFEEPTPIQKQTIPLLLTGQDVTGQAHTGTGKTAAYAIPSIERCDPSNRKVQALVLSPTRELTVQIADEYSRILAFKPELRAFPIYGGQDIERQFRELKRGIQICIGTPGRIIDHITRKTLDLSEVKIVVLDEADQMLDMGFRPDIEEILSHTPTEGRQTVIFSATLPRAILQISKRFQKNPVNVQIIPEGLAGPGIDQYFIEVHEEQRAPVLNRLIDRYIPEKAMVFTNTRRMADVVSSQLKAQGFRAEALHGDMSQRERDRVMFAFRSGTLNILVATDVAARGIDVEDVEMVFNFDLPQDTEYYIHRIGRTARAGKAGCSVSFVTPRERWRMKEIQRCAKTKMRRMIIPSVAEIQSSRAEGVMKRISKMVSEDNLDSFIPLINGLVADGLDPIHIAAAFLKDQSAYKDTQGNFDMVNIDQRSGGEKRQTGDRRSRRFNNGAVIFSIGRDTRVSPKELVQAISGICKIPPRAVGDIKIHNSYTAVNISERYRERVISRMDGSDAFGTRLEVTYESDYQSD